MGAKTTMLETYGVTIDEEKFDSVLRWHYTSHNTKVLGKKQSY